MKRKVRTESRRSDKPGKPGTPLAIKITATLSKDELMSALHGAVLSDTFHPDMWSPLDAEELIKAGERINQALHRHETEKKPMPSVRRPARRSNVPDLERHFRYAEAT